MIFIFKAMAVSCIYYLFFPLGSIIFPGVKLIKRFFFFTDASPNKLECLYHTSFLGVV
jgi:hypothetical protein